MNILEFSKRAGVSTATVSRAFHEPEKLKEKTRFRILTLAEKLGYYPSPAGRALVLGRHDVLGLIWPLEVEGVDAFFAQRILAALTSYLVKNDLDLLVSPIDRRQPEALAHARRTLQRSRCDAWILLYPRHNDELISALKKAGKPVVCLMGNIPECPTWKSVQLNQKSWMEDALRRLKAKGCRNVLLFGSRLNEPDHDKRKKAFSECARKYFKSQIYSIGGWPPDTGELRQYLLLGKCDAIIGVDDHAALLALDTCKKANLSVPQKIKVIGIDDVPQAQFSTPPLSTYRQPLDEMVGRAVELALGTRKRSCLFNATFIPRKSL